MSGRGVIKCAAYSKGSDFSKMREAFSAAYSEDRDFSKVCEAVFGKRALLTLYLRSHARCGTCLTNILRSHARCGTCLRNILRSQARCSTCLTNILRSHARCSTCLRNMAPTNSTLALRTHKEWCVRQGLNTKNKPWYGGGEDL